MRVSTSQGHLELETRPLGDLRITWRNGSETMTLSGEGLARLMGIIYRADHHPDPVVNVMSLTDAMDTWYHEHYHHDTNS